MSQVCSNCGGSDIDFDQARGDAVCMNCGSVLEDNIIVSEVQFQENSIGGSSAIGQFVSSEGNKSGVALGSGFRHGLGKESRAVTLENGKKRINHVGHQLQMNQHCIDTAYNFYKLAVNKRLTRGRRTNHVVAACLYLVCRTERTPHMLLDFSDILNIDVFTLGRAYMKLAQELYINLPALDPCLYIHRFAHKLEFGDKEHDVAMTALRLVSRMKRDWIHHGRRPSGLCGAAILVAARLHSFNRTVREVVKVVRISDTTIRKRLGEFKDTPSSLLTIDEFQKIDLEEEQDPPSFTQAKKRVKQQSGDLNNPEIAGELEKFQEEIENLLQTSTTANSEIPANVQLPTTGISESSLKAVPMTIEDDALVIKQDIKSIMEQVEGARTKEGNADSFVEEERNSEEWTDKDTNEELDLTGLDDDELDKCLLTDNEVEIKTKLWMEENKDYLEMLKEKEAREAKEREEGANKEPKKKRKPYKKKQNVPASTAGEAIEKMLVEKKISSKINYEVLRGLETSGMPKPAEFVSKPVTPVMESKADHEFLVPRVPTRKGGRKRESAISAAPLSNLPKKRKEEDEVVIESGPVEYEKDEESNIHDGDHPEDDVEDDDDELEHVSAAQLMGHIYNDGLEDEYGDFEEDF